MLRTSAMAAPQKRDASFKPSMMKRSFAAERFPPKNCRLCSLQKTDRALQKTRRACDDFEPADSADPVRSAPYIHCMQLASRPVIDGVSPPTCKHPSQDDLPVLRRGAHEVPMELEGHVAPLPWQRDCVRAQLRHVLRAEESAPLTRERRQNLIRRPIGLIWIGADDTLQRLARFDSAGTAPIDKQHQLDARIAALYLGDVGLPHREALGQCHCVGPAALRSCTIAARRVW